MSGEKRHSSTCGEVGYCNGCTPTPEPSEVAETTAGEREVEADVVWECPVLAIGPNTDGEPCDWCQTCGEPARDHAALAALLDRERREAGEQAWDEGHRQTAPHSDRCEPTCPNPYRIARDEAAR